MSNQARSRFRAPISVPGPRLMHFVPLRFVQKRAAGGNSRSVNRDIPLIPFIDFLLCIVLFLLASFSASGETINKNVNLAKARNVSNLVDAPIVAITGTQILVDGTVAGNTRMIEEANRLQRIDELLANLKTKRELWRQINPGKEFPGVAIIQVDRKVPALVVKSVFQTAAMAGYPALSFQVARLGTASRG